MLIKWSSNCVNTGNCFTWCVFEHHMIVTPYFSKCPDTSSIQNVSYLKRYNYGHPWTFAGKSFLFFSSMSLLILGSILISCTLQHLGIIWNTKTYPFFLSSSTNTYTHCLFTTGDRLLVIETGGVVILTCVSNDENVFKMIFPPQWQRC